MGLSWELSESIFVKLLKLCPAWIQHHAHNGRRDCGRDPHPLARPSSPTAAEMVTQRFSAQGPATLLFSTWGRSSAQPNSGSQLVRIEVGD